MRGWFQNFISTQCARWLTVFTGLWCIGQSPGAAATNLISTGSAWRYWNVATDSDPAWIGRNFDDSTWSNGVAEFGYGDGDEATVIRNGADAPSITTYFRHSFLVANPRDFFGLTLRVLNDDGAVVYLNGTEVFRDNLPAGPISPQRWR
jgi:hypothetical protein